MYEKRQMLYILRFTAYWSTKLSEIDKQSIMVTLKSIYKCWPTEKPQILNIHAFISSSGWRGCLTRKFMSDMALHEIRRSATAAAAAAVDLSQKSGHAIKLREHFVIRVRFSCRVML